MLPIAATEPQGEPTRLDAFRGHLARDLLERLSACDEDSELGEALDRWELALFAGEASRSEQLREALAALLGGQDGLWAASARLAVLVGQTPSERGELFARIRSEEPDSDLVRRALVEVLMSGDRLRLVDKLDESLVGLSARPVGYYSAQAAAAS